MTPIQWRVRNPSQAKVVVTIEESETSSYLPAPPCPAHSTDRTPPPPYISTTVTTSSLSPLAFYPPAPSLHPSTGDDELPSYRSTPRTFSERCFWWGLFCPVLFLFGISKLWRPEAITGTGKHAPGAFVGEEDREWPSDVTSGNLAMTVSLWREEERIWALRCAWTLAGEIVMGAVLAVAALESFSS